MYTQTATILLLSLIPFTCRIVPVNDKSNPSNVELLNLHTARNYRTQTFFYLFVRIHCSLCLVIRVEVIVIVLRGLLEKCMLEMINVGDLKDRRFPCWDTSDRSQLCYIMWV